jgi:hypothetical protein
MDIAIVLIINDNYSITKITISSIFGLMGDQMVYGSMVVKFFLIKTPIN